jgi:hypothetical protein
MYYNWQRLNMLYYYIVKAVKLQVIILVYVIFNLQNF